MLYIIVSHKASTEIANCLIFYLKKFLEAQSRRMLEKRLGEEVCINKEVSYIKNVPRITKSAGAWVIKYCSTDLSSV